MTAVAEPKKATKKPKAEVVDIEVLPDPKPGEPGYDWGKEYPGEKVFVYTKPGSDSTVGLAAISKQRQPSIGFMRESRKKPEFEQVLDMLELVASDNALAVVDEWTAEELLLMWNERTEWNQTNAGE